MPAAPAVTTSDRSPARDGNRALSPAASPDEPPPRPDPRPLVLLDVDGVLNAVASGRPSAAWTDWRTAIATAAGRDFRITWSPSVVTAVLGWQDRADVQWLTTWGHDANRSLRQVLELPELPVAGTWEDPDTPAGGSTDDLTAGAHADVTPAAPDRLTGRWWKFDVVRRLVRAAPSRPVVWLDDDLAGQAEVAAWMRQEAPCLLVAPDPRSGLTAADLQSVAQFLGA